MRHYRRFSWNNLIGFWVPVGFFFVWLLGTILPFTTAPLKRDLLVEAQ